ncbi:MAG: NAD(P)-dependent oxidoreductase [Betaproteobacteria bacterium]
MKIAFIGLGRMGWHMAAHLQRAGHALCVYDTSPTLPTDWVKAFGGRAAASVAEAVTDAEIVMTSLPADAALSAVWELAQPTLAPSAIWVDHSTTSAEIARRLANIAASEGRHFIDAPVSGGTVGAEKGTLAIMAGADPAAWKVVEPVMAAYAQRCSLIGEPGAGQLTKMSNQICVAGIGQALAEGLAFAEHNGLDPRKVLDVMLKGSSTSWMMENRAETMIDGKFDFGFSTTLMRKDLGLVMDEARRADVSLPVTGLVAQLLSDVSAMGLAKADWCSLMQRQRRVQSGK